MPLFWSWGRGPPVYNQWPGIKCQSPRLRFIHWTAHSSPERRKWHIFCACMVRPLKIALLLLSVHPLPDQCLLHLYSTHWTDLPTYLPQASASDCSYQKGSEGRVPLLVSLVTNEPTWHQFPPISWPPCPACCSHHTVGCHSRTLLQTPPIH